MTTTTAAAVPQVRLAGQVAAPEGPVDLLMMYAMHHAFRRDLDDFASAAAATPVAALPAWAALQRRWRVLATALHHHHSGEDAGLWPLLMERADAADRATLEAMSAEHARIDPVLEACAAGFHQMTHGGTGQDRAALAAQTAAARDLLLAHLAHEETESLALVQRHMTQQEWLDLEAEHFAPRTSLREAFSLVPWVCLGVPADVRERAFAETGGPFRLIWLLTRRRFGRLQRRAFAYA